MCSGGEFGGTCRNRKDSNGEKRRYKCLKGEIKSRTRTQTPSLKWSWLVWMRVLEDSSIGPNCSEKEIDRTGTN